MELKHTSRPVSSSSWRPYLLIAFTFCLTCILCGIIGLGMLKQASPYRYQQLLRSIPQFPTAVWRYIAYAGTEMPVVKLHVNHLNLQQLAFERHQFFIEKNDIDYEFVSGKLQLEEEEYPIKIRLKGDRFIHVSDLHRWSFRIQMKEDNTVMGMKYFSLHRAGARNYLYEWIFHRMLKEEGFVALRYEFVQVYLNGKSLGVYAMEEHFDKRLIEHSQFREGPILKFDEGLTGDLLNLSVVRPFREEQYIEDEPRVKLERASALLEGFRRGELGIGEVFDVEKLATFFAITDVLSVRHGSMWKSLRFYYNPISDRIEPIGFDGHFNPELAPRFFLAAESSQQPNVGFCRERASWYDHVFFPSDTVESVFFSAYVKALDRMAQDSFLDAFFEKNEAALEQNLSRIYSDFSAGADHVFWYGPDLHYFSKDVFYQKKGYIQNLLRPKKHLLFAFRSGESRNETSRNETSPQSIEIEVSNVHSLPQVVKTLYLDTLSIPLPSPIELVPRVFSDFVAYSPGYRYINIVLPPDIVWHDSMWHQLRLGYSVLGVEEEQIVEVSPWRRANSEFRLPGLMHQHSTLDQFPFMQVDEAKKEIIVAIGTWSVDNDLIIPKGYVVSLDAGTHLDLRNQAAIVSHSPWICNGSVEQPIRVMSSDRTGQGLLLFQTDAVSRFSHVIFSQLAPPTRPSWALTGAVTMYESEAIFEEVHWQACTGEDALNLIRSEFEISHCYVDQAESDAIDIDFCKGTIRECWVSRSGNDGLDVSGSTVQITGLTVEDAGDKGISIGEDSDIEAKHLFLKKMRTGLAVKDHSHLTATNLRLDSCEIGWAIYQKKSEYGQASARLNQVLQSGIGIPYLIEQGSSCELNGQTLPAEGVAILKEVDRLE